MIFIAESRTRFIVDLYIYLCNSQPNHSQKPHLPATACQEATPRAAHPPPPAAMITPMMLRQHTWPPPPSWTYPHAAGNGLKTSVPNSRNKLARYGTHWLIWFSCVSLFLGSKILQMHHRMHWCFISMHCTAVTFTRELDGYFLSASLDGSPWGNILSDQQDMDIEVDENGTLDLSMKKPKREGVQSPDPSSSSSSSSQQQGGVTSPHPAHTYKQEEWEGPLDYTKPVHQKEEELDEVTKRNQLACC